MVVGAGVSGLTAAHRHGCDMLHVQDMQPLCRKLNGSFPN